MTLKSHKKLKPTNLCHIEIRLEAYKAQTGLMQRYNCQNFGYIWANCKQPPHCMWCGSGHLHKECPEKGNTALIPTCCNCKLVVEEEPHPSNYQGCSHAKKGMQKGKWQKMPKTTTGRVVLIQTHHPRTILRGGAVLRSNIQQEQRPQPSSVAQACTPSFEAQAATGTNQVSQFRLLMQTVLLSDMFKVVNNDISSDYDRAHWSRVRRKHYNGRHKNCIKIHEAKWSLEIIGTKYDCAGEDQQQL
jgi:hypothetical protein